MPYMGLDDENKKPKVGNSLVRERPFHSDNQVLSFEDLIVGTVYIEHSNLGGVGQVVCLSVPYRNQLGEWVFEAANLMGGVFSFREAMSLEDWSIIASGDDWWVGGSYLEITSDVVAEDELQKLRMLPWRGVSIQPDDKYRLP